MLGPTHTNNYCYKGVNAARVKIPPQQILWTIS